MTDELIERLNSSRGDNGYGYCEITPDDLELTIALLDQMRWRDVRDGEYIPAAAKAQMVEPDTEYITCGEHHWMPLPPVPEQR